MDLFSRNTSHFFPFYHCVIAYYLSFISHSSHIKSVTSSFWSSSQFQHPVLITAWAIDSSNILYENKVLSTACFSFTLISTNCKEKKKKQHLFVIRKLMFPCSGQASMWTPPLIIFVLVCSLVIIDHFIDSFTFFLVVCNAWKEGKAAAEI